VQMRTATSHATNKSKSLVEKILNKIGGLSKPRKFFMKSIVVLYLSMRGRYTFKGLQRYGDKCEKSYRLQFEQAFDFLSFNVELCKSHLSGHCVLAFDPSYLPKSGKHTPGKGKFWSGCLGKAVQGIEIGGLGVVDMKHNTAFNLEAVQTPSPAELKAQGRTLVNHYADLIIKRWEKIAVLSAYLAADGYFAKQTFIDPVLNSTGLHLISKLRKDANLRYLYKGPKRTGRGRAKKYDGKVNTKQIDKRRFKQIYKDEDVIIYQAILWSVSLKRSINVTYVDFLAGGQATDRYAIFFSTDLELAGQLIYQYYKARFQIEFLFRDAKQQVGLTHCQARSENKLHFHINTSLTAVGIAKIAHHMEATENKKSAFSIANIKTTHFNELMLNLFLLNFQIDPELKKNKSIAQKLLNFGKIAA